MAQKFFFITRVPDEPGSLQQAASVIRKYGGNINRIHYDRRIDPFTVFFEMTAAGEMAEGITRDLRFPGFLRSFLPAPGFLKFSVCLPHRPRSLVPYAGVEHYSP